MFDRFFGAGRRSRTEPGHFAPESPSPRRTLQAIVGHAAQGRAVRKGDLVLGDRVIIRTRNSVYSLWPLGNGTFAVSGGWFDLQGLSPATVGVNGCTYGGSVIRQDVIAAPGLFLEFGNNVATTRIQAVEVFHDREVAVKH